MSVFLYVCAWCFTHTHTHIWPCKFIDPPPRLPAGTWQSSYDLLCQVSPVQCSALGRRRASGKCIPTCHLCSSAVILLVSSPDTVWKHPVTLTCMLATILKTPPSAWLLACTPSKLCPWIVVWQRYGSVLRYPVHFHLFVGRNSFLCFETLCGF